MWGWVIELVTWASESTIFDLTPAAIGRAVARMDVQTPNGGKKWTQMKISNSNLN